MTRRVFDCFTFFNEIELLKVRLEELDSVVDFFVIAEAPITFRGARKPLHFRENAAQFEKFADKIIHVVVDDLPETSNPWEREFAQRDALDRGCAAADDHDLILISDADEIFRADAVAQASQLDGYIAFDMPMFQYYMNLRAEKNGWNRAFGYAWKDRGNLRNLTSGRIDKELLKATFGERYHYIDNAGWHFTYLGGRESIRTKLQSFSHTEEWFQTMLQEGGIEAHVRDGGVVGNFWHLAEYVPIDASFPAGVRRREEYFRSISYIRDIFEAHRDLQAGNRDIKVKLGHAVALNSQLRAVIRLRKSVSFSKIISIGSFCMAAAHLKAAEVRDAAYPFDWLFSNPPMVADCIEDDFRIFLDPQYLRPVSDGAKCQHAFYQARYPMGEGAIFNHHNPSQEPDRGHFERAIARFKVALHSPSPPLLLMIMDARSFAEPMLRDVARIYQAAYAAPILLILIEQSYAQPRGKVDVGFQQDGIMVAKYFSQSLTSDGMLFDDPTDTEMFKNFLSFLMAKV